jgi:hypothetical protein
MGASIVCIAISYVLPILVATTAARIPYADYRDGTFTQVRVRVLTWYLPPRAPASWTPLTAARAV